jgi:hypothetical protein
VPVPARRIRPSEDQPALPLDLAAPELAPPRAPRTRSRAHGEAPVQLTFCLEEEDDDQLSPPPELSSLPIEPLSIPAAAADDEPGAAAHLPAELADAGAGAKPRPTAELPPRVSEPVPPPIHGFQAAAAGEELSSAELEPLEFDPDPFAEIPGFARAVSAAQEFVLLPGSLRGRLDLREFTRFLASLPTVAKDWEGAPEIDDGGIRLRGPEGGAWIYPEANRVRLVTDGGTSGSVGEDLVALCRWLEGRAGMRLYPAGETRGAGVDRSLDPWEAFLEG